MQQEKLTFILWANHLEETVAAVFVTELRRMGLPVKVVGLHRQAVAGSYGLVLAPDLTLEQAAPQFRQVRCLVLPGPAERMDIFSQHPRLNELMAFIGDQGIFVAAASSGRAQQIGSINRSTFIEPLVYPIDDSLVLFARGLASRLANEPFLPVNGAGIAAEKAGIAAEKIVEGTRKSFDGYKEGASERSILRVAGNTPIRMLAGAIAGQIRQWQRSELQAIGMGAVYQTVKAVIIAQEYLRSEDITLACIPKFVRVGTVEYPRTALRFTVYRQIVGEALEVVEIFGGSAYD